MLRRSKYELAQMGLIAAICMIGTFAAGVCLAELVMMGHFR